VGVLMGGWLGQFGFGPGWVGLAQAAVLYSSCACCSAPSLIPTYKLCTVRACGVCVLCVLCVLCVRAGNYAPTPTHHFIKLLHDKGLLLRCFSQNIDSLEHQVGACGWVGGAVCRGGLIREGVWGR
jgi:hypothetical protein